MTSGVRPSASINAGIMPTRLPSTLSLRCSVKSTAQSWLVQSYGSWPAPVSAFMASATSSTVRPKGPTWSSDEPKATTP